MQNHFVVSQLGARERYEVPLSFQKMGWLKAFVTDYWSPFGMVGTNIRKVVKTKLINRSLERWSPNLDSSIVRPHNLLGIQMALALSTCYDGTERSKIITDFGKKFSKCVAEDVRLISHNSYFGLCSEALEALDYEKRLNNFTILFQYDSGNDEEIIEKECQLWPGWNLSFHRCKDFYERIYEEWSCANVILVNSSWAKESIIKQGAPQNKIVIVAQSYTLTEMEIKRISKIGAFKVLYVGGVNLRKGVQYLIEAAKLLMGLNIEFIIIGGPEVSKDEISKFPPNVILTGHLPHAKVKEYYLQSDVFVFPTLSDGFGRVQLEAMSYGLPVIATTNCGEVVTDRKNGFIVPVCDAEAIAKCIQTLYSDRELLVQMRIEAKNTIPQFSKEKFAESIRQIVKSHKLG